MTWETYEEDLDRRIEDLHARVKRGAYRALPSRRSYIPKEDGSKRPLVVAALEDKIVQRATAAVLSAIFEEDFLGLSYGPSCMGETGKGADQRRALASGVRCFSLLTLLTQ
jgi:retron-type reverse transcriptase